mmetsp:Transcript_9512/g.28615  ORF Transcript_9512/g.28615 Transcript_9512/m.28615 type:complete len:235 (+) Transcript_9512:2921-3625(+)
MQARVVHFVPHADPAHVVGPVVLWLRPIPPRTQLHRRGYDDLRRPRVQLPFDVADGEAAEQGGLAGVHPGGRVQGGRRQHRQRQQLAPVPRNPCAALLVKAVRLAGVLAPEPRVALALHHARGRTVPGGALQVVAAPGDHLGGATGVEGAQELAAVAGLLPVLPRRRIRFQPFRSPFRRHRSSVILLSVRVHKILRCRGQGSIVSRLISRLRSQLFIGPQGQVGATPERAVAPH